MTTTISTLWITLIGMGLVFIGLLALWGMMELIVKLTARYNLRHPEEAEEEEETGEEIQVVAAPPAADVLKPQAAAVAVAVALALEAESEAAAPVLSYPQFNGGQASAWQAVMRSAQLNQRSNQFSRKPRGNVQ